MMKKSVELTCECGCSSDGVAPAYLRTYLQVRLGWRMNVLKLAAADATVHAR